MSLPTQYYLTFKPNNCGEYDVYESHRCQEKGCFWTTEQPVTTCIPGNEAKFVKDYNKNLIEGYVCGYEIEEYIEVEEWNPPKLFFVKMTAQ